jgi:hypothetical protein
MPSEDNDLSVMTKKKLQTLKEGGKKPKRPSRLASKEIRGSSNGSSSVSEMLEEASSKSSPTDGSNINGLVEPSTSCRQEKQRQNPFSLELASISAEESSTNRRADWSHSLSPRLQDEGRKNPFSLPSVKSPTPESFPTTHISPELPHTPPAKASSLSPSSKRVIQLNGNDSSGDDSDYVPPTKRNKIQKLSSPRHSPKAIFTSPKKLDREKLSVRRVELEDERRKLPIWTGIPLFVVISH